MSYNHLSIRPLVAIVALVSFDAQAYIDPGTGSMLIQGIIAAALGAGFALKTFYRVRIKAFIDLILRRPKIPDENAPLDRNDPESKDK